MALTKCPHCGASISDKAHRCPKCGNIISTVVKKYPQNETIQHKPTGSVVASPVPSPAPFVGKIRDEQSQPAPNASVFKTEDGLKEQYNTPSIPKKRKKHTWLIVTIVAIVFLLVGSGGAGYWYYQNIYLPEKIDREAPRTFPIVNVQLRSSKMAGGDFNKLLTVPYGGELITYSYDDEWAKVKYVNTSSNTKTEGYIASPYLLDRKDFYILNSLLGDNTVREIVATAKVRRALLDYYKANGYVGKISDELLAEVGLTAKPEQQWQIFFHHGQAKPNEILFKRLSNQSSKYTDMCVLIENINSHARKVLYFKFDDDETPHLVFDGDAPIQGDIKDVIFPTWGIDAKKDIDAIGSPNSYKVVYTSETREYTKKG